MYLFADADNEIQNCPPKICNFSKLSVPVQPLISGEVILSEICIKRFEDQQMCTIRSVI